MKNEDIELPKQNTEEEQRKKEIEEISKLTEEINKEEEKRKKQEQQTIEEIKINKANESQSISWPPAIVLTIIVFILCFITTKGIIYTLLAIPFIICIESYIIFKKQGNKDEYDFNIVAPSLMLICGIILYFVSQMTDSTDLYNIALEMAITGTFSYIIITIIKNTLINKQSLLVPILLSIIISLLLGGGILLDDYYKLDIVTNITHKESEDDKLSKMTYEEKILYLLNKRYNETFTKKTNTIYKSSDNTEFEIQTNTTTQNNSKFILLDDYLNNKQINKITSKIEQIIINKYSKYNGRIDVNLAPSSDCRFVGSCISDDSYYDNYQANTDENLLAARSNEIDLSKYLNMSNADFFNEFGFKIFIEITATDADTQSELRSIANYILNNLNESDYENNKGFEIKFLNSNSITTMLTISGKARSDKQFIAN